MLPAAQIETWFLKINPAGTVPALVHEGKPVAGCEAICRFVDKTFPGASLCPSAASATVDKFLKLVADVAHDDLVNGYFLKSGHPGAAAAATARRSCSRRGVAPRRKP